MNELLGLSEYMLFLKNKVANKATYGSRHFLGLEVLRGQFLAKSLLLPYVDAWFIGFCMFVYKFKFAVQPTFTRAERVA